MGIYLVVGDNIWKRMLIPDVIYGLKEALIYKAFATR
jgi:hypothetical protein